MTSKWAPEEPLPTAIMNSSSGQVGPFSRDGLPTAKTPRVESAGRKQRVAVVIPAKDQAEHIAATVRAARAIPHVDLVLVVDDGSEDDTQHVARSAGAVVVRHPHNQGKAAALETGVQVVAMRDAPGGLKRLLLFIDDDMGEAAVNAAPLLPPVLEGVADIAIALVPEQPEAKRRNAAAVTARRAIRSMTGWTPTQPTGGMRCMTQEAFEVATPLSRGWGVEVGMTIDQLRAGYVAVEVPCDLQWRPTSWDTQGPSHRLRIMTDVTRAINTRRLRALMSRG
ncbi:MAG: glycosyltransferase family 2 protein [Promicromonosporaceae bacterium]|nr:glycosyltransferase family 2 protein [Promicromonosporaceae bacterium]